MAEYVDKDKLGKAIYNFGGENFYTLGVLSLLRDFPTDDVAPVRHSIIVDRRKVEVDGEWTCARCSWQYTVCVCGKDVTRKIHYCPNCGAKLGGDGK